MDRISYYKKVEKKFENKVLEHIAQKIANYHVELSTILGSTVLATSILDSSSISISIPSISAVLFFIVVLVCLQLFLFQAHKQ